MRPNRVFILLSLACFGEAGPLIAAVASVAGAVAGEGAATAVAGSSLAGAFGLGASSVWYGGMVVVDGALYYGSGAAAGAAVAGAAAGMAVGLGGSSGSK